MKRESSESREATTEYDYPTPTTMKSNLVFKVSTFYSREIDSPPSTEMTTLVENYIWPVAMGTTTFPMSNGSPQRPAGTKPF